MSDGVQLGKQGESWAAAYLEGQGYVILERNYSLRLGEIDIIARDGDELVFVEVKSRRSVRFGVPEEAVTRRKQRRISRVALAYLSDNGLLDVNARFDVVSIVAPGDGAAPRITQHKNAFDLCHDGL